MEEYEEDDDFDCAARRGHFLDVDVSCVPVAQGFTDIETIFERRGEFFGSREVLSHQLPGLLAHVTVETFDLVVLGRVGTLPEGVPLHLPFLLLLLC